jgi:hypothetical protein
MSAMPAASYEGSGDRGYLMLLRGQAFKGYDPAKHGPLWNFRQLPGRAGDAGALLFHLIYNETYSALGCPEWAQIPLREFCEYSPHKGARAIRRTLNFLVRIQLIERHPDDPWRFKAHPENIAAAPLLMPVRHPNAAAKKRRKRAAKMSAPVSIAALRNRPEVQQANLQAVENGSTGPTNGSDGAGESTVPAVEFDPTAPIGLESAPAGLKPVSSGGEGRIIQAARASVQPPAGAQGPPNESDIEPGATAPMVPVGSAAGMKLISTDRETPELNPVSIEVKLGAEIARPISTASAVNVSAAETHCPIGWACPYLVSDLDNSQPLIQVIQTLEVNHSTAVPEPAPDRPASSEELEQIRQLLLSELSDKLPGERPTDRLCERIHLALKGCPLEWICEGSRGIGLLRHKIVKCFYRIQSYGFVEHIARDVGKSWEDHQVKARQQQQEERARTENSLIQRVKDHYNELHENFRTLKNLAESHGQDR